MIIKDKYIYSCRSRMERIIFDKHRYNSMKSSCSSSVEASSLDALCIRSVFNVSFSYRFMGGYLTQIWSIYVHFSPRSHFTHLPTIPGFYLVWGAKRVSIFSGTLVPRFCAPSFPQTSTNINNCPRNSNLVRRFVRGSRIAWTI